MKTTLVGMHTMNKKEERKTESLANVSVRHVECLNHSIWDRSESRSFSVAHNKKNVSVLYSGVCSQLSY
jgi:hypothetical protein